MPHNFPATPTSGVIISANEAIKHGGVDSRTTWTSSPCFVRRAENDRR